MDYRTTQFGEVAHGNADGRGRGARVAAATPYVRAAPAAPIPLRPLPQAICHSFVRSTRRVSAGEKGSRPDPW